MRAMKTKGLILACLLLAVISVPVSAQSPSHYGKFKVILVDIRGRRVGKASVEVEGVKGQQFSRKLVSNKSGEFEIDLPVGSYQIRIMKPGFMVLILTSVDIEADTRCTQKFLISFYRPPQTTH